MTSTPAIDGAPSLVSVAFDLGTVGYAVHEHFVSGTATAYAAVAPFEPDGRWDAEETSAAEFMTRCVVHSPLDPSHANGTVIFEWLNVTGGLDFPAVWMMSHRHLVRDGYTWVGVTAQIVGLEGGGMLPGLGLQQTAPDRYASLVHPGDEYSYDLFTQTAREVRSLLTEEYDIPVERMIAVGTSQSAVSRIEVLDHIDEIAFVDLSRYAAVVGLELSAKLYPAGGPLRGKGHQALIGRFRAVLSPSWSVLAEAPFPNLGDKRSWDLGLRLDDQRVGIEAETGVRDAQRLVRRIRERDTDGGMDEILLVLADTRGNRAALTELLEALGPRFATPAGPLLAALRNGTALPGSGVLLI